MRTITIRDANANLYKLIDEATALPIQIVGPESSVVLISEDGARFKKHSI